ncbi:MAG: hypothetical protein KDA32_14965, partial [Phycisphaerales bacterium]|nr:hypothetical protein [Phycisphaerales bacterium]
MRRSYMRTAMIMQLAIMCAANSPAAKIVSVLADFEADDFLTSAEGLVASVPTDWTIEPAAIPARGQRSLAITAASTKPNPGAVIRLQYRNPARFEQADLVSARAWLNQGAAQVAFVVEDALGRSFSTTPADIGGVRRWAELRSKLDRDALGKPRGQTPDAAPDIEPVQWPLEIVGIEVRFAGAGRHTLYFDDFEIEHDVAPIDIVRGEFFTDRMSPVVDDGAEARFVFSLENRSKTEPVNGALDLTLYAPDGAKIAEERRTVTLPPKGADYRSKQTFPFSRATEDAGFYRAVARLTSGATPSVEWSHGLIVLPQRPDAVRGRDQLFGVRAALFDQTPVDRLFEIEAAAALGAHLIAIETPWDLIQPRNDPPSLDELERLAKWAIDRRLEPMIVLTRPPSGLPAGEPGANQERLLAAIVGRLGRGVRHYQLASEPGVDMNKVAMRVRAKLASLLDDVVILAPDQTDTSTGPAAVRFEGAPGEVAFHDDAEGTGCAIAAVEAKRLTVVQVRRGLGHDVVHVLHREFHHYVFNGGPYELAAEGLGLAIEVVARGEKRGKAPGVVGDLLEQGAI